MIDATMYKDVQTFKRQGYSKGEIGRVLRLDPKTVAKYFGMREEDFKAYRQGHLFREKVFDPHREEILEIYGANGDRALQISSVFDYLEERHGALPGNEQTLRHYVGYLLETEKLQLEDAIRIYGKVPELPWGQQMQLDFGRYRCRGGLVLYIFAAVLSASRYKYVVFQGQPFRTLDMIRHLLACFEYFGGRPAEVVIDQDRLMVVSENDGDIILTKEFRQLVEEQELRLYVCRKADPETKGKVENLVKFVKGSFFNSRDFEDVEAANAAGLGWLARRANGKISQATRRIPADLIEEERPHLRPLRNSIFGRDRLLGREERTANDKALISVQACNYQLPARYKGKKVEIYTTTEELFVFDLYGGQEIISYRLSLIPGQVVSTRTCRRENEKTVEELKAGVRQLFDLEAWQRFVERNFKVFPRYARDQCLEARRFFGRKEVDRGLLEKALVYCLENDTPSFPNLKDAYVHYERESRRIEPVVAGEAAVSVSYPPIEVSRRCVSDYESAARERAAS